MEPTAGPSHSSPMGLESGRAAGGLCYKARKEAKLLGYDFDQCLADFSQDLFDSDVCLCV